MLAKNKINKNSYPLRDRAMYLSEIKPILFCLKPVLAIAEHSKLSEISGLTIAKMNKYLSECDCA